MTHCAFVVLLRGYRYSGREGRFYASLRHIAKASDLSKATIIRALAQLRRLQLITRLHCIRCNRSHSCNSYYPTDMVWGTGSSQESLLIGGGIIFTQPQISNKITKDSMGREKIYGVAEFDISYKNPDGQTGWQLFFFDGTGVKVSAHEEQILASWGEYTLFVPGSGPFQLSPSSRKIESVCLQSRPGAVPPSI